MKNVRSLVAVAAVVISMGAVSLAASGSASASAPCVVGKAGGFTVNADKTITASFEVKGDADCTQPVSVLTWNADSTLYPKPEFFTSQVMFDRSTQIFGVGVHTLTVKLPTCTTDTNVIRSYQADVVAGADPAATITAPGVPGYYWEAQSDGSFRNVDYKIAPGTCPAPAVTTAAATTPVAATPVAAQPTTLVNTGAGDVAAIAAGATAAGAAAYQLVVRKKLARN